jgi:hypothetical protein
LFDANAIPFQTILLFESRRLPAQNFDLLASLFDWFIALIYSREVPERVDAPPVFLQKITYEIAHDR